MINSAFPQSGGVNSIFNQGGAGARALGLGSAYVALADEPSVVYWNPAGLDFIPKNSASFYYSNGIVGTHYSFIGFAYPTLSIGGFGFGWLRIASGDVTERDEFGAEGSTGSFSQNQFLFGYAKQIKSYLSFGASLKIETISQIANLSDSGVGFDLGVLYKPDFSDGWLRDLSIGANVQNFVKPTVKLIDENVSSPMNFKAGLAKLFRFGIEGKSALTILFDINKSQRSSMKFNFGSEYSFNQRAMLRVGFGDGKATFGAGAIYSNFRFDYTFGKLFDAEGFSGNHRFSLTIDIGKSKTERLEIARQRQEKELQISVDNQLWFENKTDFEDKMSEGREKYYNQDYLGAVVDFSGATEAARALFDIASRFRSASMGDLEANDRYDTANTFIQESETMFKLANAKYDSASQINIEQIVQKQAQSQFERDLRNFVLRERQRGDAFFKNGRFNQAITIWQEALNRLQADNGKAPQWAPEVIAGLQSSIKAAQSQLEGNVEEAIKRADNLARRGDYVSALNVLNELIGSGLSAADLNTVNSKRNRYQAQLTFRQNYDAGVRNYERRDWSSAASAFKRALQARPGDANARRYYEDAKARSQAKKQPLPPELHIKFARGLQFYQQGKYTEALDIWEGIRKVQPYNKQVLDAIDRARERLRKK